MLEKSIFFSRIPKYLYDKDKTPYFTAPKNMTIAQSQYELFSYGVFIGTISLFIGLAALVTYLKTSENIYLLWTALNVAILFCIHLTIRKSLLFCSYVIAFVPLVFLSILMYEGIINESSLLKLAFLSVLMMIFTKYALRLIKIVYYQNNKPKE